MDICKVLQLSRKAGAARVLSCYQVERGSDMRAQSPPAAATPEEFDALKETLTAAHEKVVVSHRELSVLIKATAELVEKSRASIAKLDELLAKRL